MGSTLEYMACDCGGTLQSEYFYRTGEKWRFCSRCGFKESAMFKRENGEIVREDVFYPLDGKLVLGVRKYDNEASEKPYLIWQSSIIANTTQADIDLFMGNETGKNLIPDWMKPAFMSGQHRSIFAITDDGPKQVPYIGDDYRLDTENNRFIHNKAVWEIMKNPGNGVASFTINKVATIYSIDYDSEQDALGFWEQMLIENKNIDVSTSYLTYRDKKTGEINVLMGTAPLYEDSPY